MTDPPQKPLDYERRRRVKVVQPKPGEYERIETGDLIRYGLRVVSLAVFVLAFAAMATGYSTWVYLTLFGLGVCLYAAPWLKDL